MRPPLSTTFDLPTRAELLALAVGDSVKLIVETGEGFVERMWVTITDREDFREWKGTLSNEPLLPDIDGVLEHGVEITFHPLDIIGIE